MILFLFGQGGGLRLDNSYSRIFDVLVKLGNSSSTMKLSVVPLLWMLQFVVTTANAFGIVPVIPRRVAYRNTRSMSEDAFDEIKFSSEEEKRKVVGNLVEDDEWNGLGMELSEAICKAISEDVKKNAREFLGKEDYQIGDITKEVDRRVKDVATAIAIEIGDSVGTKITFKVKIYLPLPDEFKPCWDGG